MIPLFEVQWGVCEEITVVVMVHLLQRECVVKPGMKRQIDTSGWGY